MWARNRGRNKGSSPYSGSEGEGKGEHAYILTHALLNPGSNKTFCSQDLIDLQLRLKGTDTSLSLSTLSDGKTSDAQIVALRVTGIGRGCKRDTIQLPQVYYLPTFPSLVSSVATQADATKWPHMGDIDVPKVIKSGVTIPC